MEKGNAAMPEISRFFKIIIRMFYKDHAPPHFHAFYNEYKATFSIDSGERIEGIFLTHRLR